GPTSPVVPAVDKVLPPKVKPDAHPVAPDDSVRLETVRADIPVEKVTSATGAVSPENTSSSKGQNNAKVGEAITEAPISSVPAARPATMEEKPVQVAQAPSPNDAERHNNTAVAGQPVEIAQAPEDAHPTTPTVEGKSPRKSLHEESIPSPAPAGEFGTPSGQEYTGRKISLDFKNADVHDVLRILADVSGLNIVATDDVKARV